MSDRESWRARRAKTKRAEKAVERAVMEWLDKLTPAIEANPGMKLIDIVHNEPLSLWFTYALIVETKRLKWLTVVLAILTAALVGHAIRLAWA
jgi:hypothetical protein